MSASRSRTLSVTTALGASAFGGFALIGSIYDLPAFQSMVPGWPEMPANAALACILLGSAIVLAGHEDGPRWRRGTVKTLASAVVALALVSLVGEALRLDFGIDEIFHRDATSPFESDARGHMAPNSALSLALLGGAVLLSSYTTPNGRVPAPYLALLAILIAIFGLLGYVYGVAPLYGLAARTHMAVNGALAFLMLGVACLSLRPNRGLMAILVSSRSSGAMARRLLPASIGIPAFLGWIILGAQRSDLYGPELATAILVVLSIVFFFALTLWSGLSLDARDRDLLRRSEQQAAVASLGQRALYARDLGPLLRDAASTVARTLNVELAKVLELLPDGNGLLLRAGVGWKPGLVGRASVSAGHESQAGFTLLRDRSVVVEDLAAETRFEGPPLLRDHGVVSGMSTVIRTGEGPYGVLGAHTSRPRTFSVADVHFLESVANVLGTAIERGRDDARRDHYTRQLNELARLSATLEWGRSLEPTLRTITRGAREIIGSRTATTALEPRSADEERIVFRSTSGHETRGEEGGPEIENVLEIARKRRGPTRVPETGLGSSEQLLRTSHLISPILTETGELGGVLWLADRYAGDFSSEDEAIVSQLANIATVAIGNARLYTELEQRVAERTRELRETNVELEGFCYSVSHDLRAPLRAIQGFSHALLEDCSDRLDETGLDYARRLAGAAQRMDQLIQDLLAYSRISRGALELQPVSLDSVIQRALSQLEEEVRQRHARIRVAEGLPVVLGHTSTLVQTIANLVGNAVKFVPPTREPQVRIASETFNGTVRLWVEDNGIGIEPENQQRIFRIFERLHGVEEYPGTGVGLAIVRKGIERLGGRVGVESESGNGSRFWIELPGEES